MILRSLVRSKKKSQSFEVVWEKKFFNQQKNKKEKKYFDYKLHINLIIVEILQKKSRQ